jgi:hypothetical protein
MSNFGRKGLVLAIVFLWSYISDTRKRYQKASGVKNIFNPLIKGIVIEIRN